MVGARFHVQQPSLNEFVFHKVQHLPHCLPSTHWIRTAVQPRLCFSLRCWCAAAETARIDKSTVECVCVFLVIAVAIHAAYAIAYVRYQ